MVTVWGEVWEAKVKGEARLSCKFSIVQYNSYSKLFTLSYQTTGENDRSDFKALNSILYQF